MKVALIGYGRMGHSIEGILQNKGHEVIARFGSEGIEPEILQKADVAIEFSLPEVAFSNLKSCFELGVPVVTGTTGWLDRYQEALELCEKHQGGMIYASNFSLGVNLFFALNSYLARLMKNFPNYEVSLEEIHHIHKKDAPSGTAISLAEGVLAEREDYKSWKLKSEPHGSDQLPIEAIRKEEVPGTHCVNYRNAIDEIEIKHTAHSREGFALGAVLAAEYLNGKKGVYSMRDVLNLPSWVSGLR